MRMEVVDRVEKAVMRRMLNLPSRLAKRIFGPQPSNDRGAHLELQTHILMRLIEATNQPELAEMSVEAARKLYRDTNIAMDVEVAEIPTIVDHSVPGAAIDLPARIYRSGPGTRPCVVFFHGGGFVLGDLDSYDGVCSNFAKWSDCVVVSIDYRLAPEHPFPAAVEDAISAFRWIASNPGAFDIDPNRIAVAGDSAGANLAAVVSHATVDDEVPPALQVLIYPTTDYKPGYPSMELFAEGYFLTARNMVWFTDHYMQGQEVADARISPILQDQLDGLPPCYLMTAGFDPLRDEGEAYGDRLDEAGVRVVRREAPGLVHGFFTMGGVIAEAAATCEQIAREVGAELARSRPND